MKKVIYILLITVFCLGLASCGNTASVGETESSETAASETEASDETVTSTEETTGENYSMTVGYADESEIEGAIYYENSDSESAVYLKITFSQDVTDFTFMDVNAEIDEEGAILVTAGKTYGEKSDVPVGTAVVIKTDMPETVPFSGITLKAADGTQYRYYITMSGEDGSPRLRGW